MIRVLIVDDISSTRENLQKLLSFEDDIETVGTAEDGRKAIETTKQLKPDVVLMDVNMPDMDGIQATEVLAQEVPTSPVIIMSVQGERDYLRRAMQAGAREFLIKPFSSEELVSAIRRVYQLERKKEIFITQSGPVEQKPAAGEVIVVFSGKGGVGTSTIASNLAIALAQETKARVVIVDLDLQFGDVGVLLALDHSRSITDLLEVQEGQMREMLGEVLANGPAGVKALLSPIRPELADLVTTDHVRAVMTELRNMFDYIVVDTSSHLAEFNLEVIEMATKVVVITSLTIPSIKNAKLALQVLDSLNIEAEKTVLVVNRVDPHSDFNRESVEQNLHTKIAIELPHEPRVATESVNRGSPFVLTSPEGEISRALRELVSKLAPVERESAAVGASATDDKDKPKKKGIFGR